MPFVETLNRAKAESADQLSDTWLAPLLRLRGATGADGIERLSTQSVFEALDLPQAQRTPGAARRLAQLMQKLGWSPVRLFSLNQRGTRDQVRGYARELRK